MWVYVFLDLKAEEIVEAPALRKDWGKWVIFPLLTLTPLIKF